LIADDDVDTADTLRQLLELEGYQIEVAHDGHSALKQCLAFHPEVLLLDIGLPEIDGFNVAKQLRSKPLGRNLTIIAISGWGGESHRQAGIEAGFDRHLVKPIAFEQLLTLLASTDHSAAESQATAAYTATVDAV
jgi:DNA-binding response OmpR family regulator